MIFNFIIESYLKHLLFYLQTFFHTLKTIGIDKTFKNKHFQAPIFFLESFGTNVFIDLLLEIDLYPVKCSTQLLTFFL